MRVNNMPKPFLKWIGGKQRVISNIVPHIDTCSGTRFIEPFVGSAAIALQVHQNFNKLLLTDYNEDLINLYDVVKSGDINKFIYGVSQYFRPETHTSSEYYRLREVFNSSSNALERSELFIYLNRHGFNGMCRYNATGGFNIPVGHYKNPPILPFKEIVEFSKMLKDTNTDLKYCSFEEVFKSIGAGDVVYCDPPYIPLNLTSSFTSYTSEGFNWTQQQQLADLARAARGKGACVLISNHYIKDVVPQLYHGAELVKFHVHRSIAAKASSRKQVEEVLAIFRP